jgi:hypothetical protein
MINRYLIAFLLSIFILPLAIFMIWRWKIGSVVFRLCVTLLGVFFIRHVLVLYMMMYGAIFFPEASAILRHYVFGDGSVLVLRNDYISTSGVVLHHLREMRPNEARRVRMHQKEDIRLSYALNPFEIRRNGSDVTVRQWIKFDDKGKDFTWFGPFPLPDNIVHVFDCTPFEVKSTFKYTESLFSNERELNYIESRYEATHKLCKGCSKNNYRKIVP